MTAEAPRISLGIVGGGAFGSIVARIAASLDNVRVARIYARSAEQTRARLGDAAGEFEIVTQLDAVLSDPAIDAVFIATPNYQHLPHATAALAAGKAVLLEKPAAASLAEAQALAVAARASSRPLMISTPYRFDRASMAVRDAITEGALGDVYYASGHWLRGAGIPGWGSWFTQKRYAGGGALADLGYHVIDLVLDCLGWPELTRVSGHVSGMLGKTPALTGDWRPAEPEGVFDVEDFAAGQVMTAAGTTMQLAISWAGHGIAPGKPDDHGYAWSGSAGAASLFPGSVRVAGREPIDVPEDGFVRRIRAMLREFARRARTDDARPDDAEHALAVMSVIDAIYRSSALDAEVRVGAGYVA